MIVNDQKLHDPEPVRRVLGGNGTASGGRESTVCSPARNSENRWVLGGCFVEMTLRARRQLVAVLSPRLSLRGQLAPHSASPGAL